MTRKKECHYFCHQEIDLQHFHEKYWPIRDLETYERCFTGSSRTRVWGESSPMYLYYTQAAERIHQLIPNCRLIAVLRHPVERAFSAYTHAVRDELEPLPFWEAIQAENRRKNANEISPLQAYVECGLYAKKLQPYFDRFPKEQIHIIAYDEVQADLRGVLRRLCRFLDVDPSFDFKLKARLNRSGVPKRRWIQRVVQAACEDRFPFNVIKLPFTNSGWIRTVKGIEFWNYRLLRLDESDRQKVMPLFFDDLQQLNELLVRDFTSQWGFESAEAFRPPA